MELPASFAFSKILMFSLFGGEEKYEFSFLFSLSLLLKILLRYSFSPSSINILRVCQGPARILAKVGNKGEQDKQNLPSSLEDLNTHMIRFQKSIMIICKVKKTLFVTEKVKPI